MRHKSISRRRSTQKNRNSVLRRRKNSDSDDPTGEERKKSKGVKKFWSFDTMVEMMKPTCEELDYRSAKSTELNPVEKYSKLFKCTKCQKNLKDFITNNKKAPVHPCLGVLMCEKCCAYYEDGEFSLDSDGEDKYCRWCGEGGTLLTCSKCICRFCANCIKTHFSFKFFKTIQKDENWLCFFCDPKPLWDQRYICSLAVQLAEEGETMISSTPVKQKNRKNSPSKVKSPEKTEMTISSTAMETRKGRGRKVSKVKTSEAEKAISSRALETESEEEKEEKEEEEEEECNSTKGRLRPRKRTSFKYSSSSDDTDYERPRRPVKKLKFTNSPLQNLLDQMENKQQKNVKPKALSELEKVLKLSEYQMNFGVSWCSDILKKLSKPDYKVTQEGLVEECRKIKWFLSVLSTYLVQFTNSLDSVEKSLCQGGELKDLPDIAEKEQPPYTVILQFLGFLNNQVKTFMQKGVPFSDILDAPLYEDENVIGLKKKISSRNKNCDPALKEACSINEEVEGIESKEKEDLGDTTLGDDSLEIETDQNNESNIIESENSSPYIAFDEASNSKNVESTQEIETLISILENA